MGMVNAMFDVVWYLGIYIVIVELFLICLALLCGGDPTHVYLQCTDIGRYVGCNTCSKQQQKSENIAKCEALIYNKNLLKILRVVK